MRLIFVLFIGVFIGVVLSAGHGDDITDSDGHPNNREKFLPEEEIQIRGPKGAELIYAQGSQIPYTGKTIDMWSNGQKKFEAHWKDGKEDGPNTWWYENGEKRLQIHWKDGKKDGLYTVWHENGEARIEILYKDGRRDGLYSVWHENGQARVEILYKDGMRVPNQSK